MRRDINCPHLPSSSTPLHSTLLFKPQFPIMSSASQTTPAPEPGPTSPIDPMPPVTSTLEPLPPLRSTQPPPSKLPSRPRKLRKLSPDSSISAAARKTLAVIPAPTRPLSSPGEIDAALTHLRNADLHLSKLIDLHHPPTFDAFQTPFLALTKSILYQQLAYKAGTSIYTRFIGLCGGEHGVLPSTVLELSPPQLRHIGVSARKASYLHDLARKYQNGILSDKKIIAMDDKSLFTMLTMVNGIGSWSVHMFMIFSLHRPDVLPVNDLQVRKGVQLLYGLEELPRPSQMEQLCEKWRPYRSVGSWYMWRLVEAKGTPNVAGKLGVVSLPHPRTEPQSLQVVPVPSEQTQQHQHRSHQAQFNDPVNGIINIGSNYAQLN